ncbi:MAG TPA: hypothetical protein VEH77_11960 [Roseiarcus sp.]|nr:hypothetical protein [Roseiarcus sp.]
MIVHSHRNVAHLTLLVEDDQSYSGVNCDESDGSYGERQAQSAIESRCIGVNMRLDFVDRGPMTIWVFAFHWRASKPREVCQTRQLRQGKSLGAGILASIPAYPEQRMVGVARRRGVFTHVLYNL